MSTIDLAREDLAKIIRGALVENWSCYETAGKWDEDVLLTGCKKVGNGQGYQNPEQAAQNLALDAADAILSALRASTEGGEDSSLSSKPTEAEGWARVPKEPTPEMIEEGYDATRMTDGTPRFADAGFVLGHAREIYRAMIAAAPSAPAKGE